MASRPQTFSTQARVRNALKAHARPMRIAEIRDLIGLEGDKGCARVGRAIQSLLKSKEIERSDRGSYIWVNRIPDTAYCKKQQRMQRIMWIRSKTAKPFTARKVSELSECSLYLAKEYITFLRRKGYLYCAGRTRVASTGYAPTYLIPEDKLNDAFPVMRKASKAAAVNECVEKLQELAASFFRMEDMCGETLSNLRSTAHELAEQIDRCESIARKFEKMTPRLREA